MSRALLAAEALACIRAGREVFAGVEFALEPGDVLLLRGPNGSGKSSLLRILAGFLRPAAGRIVWQGVSVAQDLAAWRSRLHYVGHADAIKSALTVRENLAFAAALAGGAAARVAQALEVFGLGRLADAPGRLLSAGQRRRLALARLLAVGKPVWLLDEPAVGLDVASRARLEQALAEHRAGGGIAIIATHGDIDVPDALVLDLEP